MSGTATGWALHKTGDIKPAMKLVLCALADEANREGLSCFPGQERIAAAAACSVRSVVRHIADLEAARLIVVDRPTRAGRGRFNRYALVIPPKTWEQQTLALIAERNNGAFKPSIWAGNHLDRIAPNLHVSSVDKPAVDNSGMVTKNGVMVTTGARLGAIAMSPNPIGPVKPAASTRSNAAGVTAADVLDRLEASGVVPDFGDTEPAVEGAQSVADLRRALPHRKDVD